MSLLSKLLENNRGSAPEAVTDKPESSNRLAKLRSAICEMTETKTPPHQFFKHSPFCKNPLFGGLLMGSLLPLLLLLSGASGLDVKYARNFEIAEFETHRLLTVRKASRNSETAYRYALVPRDEVLPKLPKAVQVIRTPVERVVAMETVYIGHMEALDQIDRIVAVATVNFINNAQVREGLEAGRIRAIQSGQALDIETILVLQPDLIISSISGDPSFDIPHKLRRTKLPFVLSAGYMERHPLARAEWIKFIGAFFEEDDRADKIFQSVERRYLELTEHTASVMTRPTVLCGAPYSGVWHVPGGKSFTAQAIKDAGGDYLWSDNDEQGGIPLDLERVFLRGAQADIWIHPSGYRSKSDLLSADERFENFGPAQTGKVYNNTRQVSETGGNAIWESGVIHPDQVLADLIRIFHPELLPDHEFVYYEQLR